MAGNNTFSISPSHAQPSLSSNSGGPNSAAGMRRAAQRMMGTALELREADALQALRLALARVQGAGGVWRKASIG